MTTRKTGRGCLTNASFIYLISGHITRTRHARPIHEHIQQIRIFQSFHGRSNHSSIQQMLGLMKPWRIEKRHLRSLRMNETHDSGPCGLRLTRDNRDFLAQ